MALEKKIAGNVTVGPRSRGPRRKQVTHVGHFNPIIGRTQKGRDDKAGLWT
jgi:hypothetical protein